MVSKHFDGCRRIGLLKCPQCGKSMIPGHTRSYRNDGSFRINYYYHCSSYNSGKLCKANSINANRVEEHFFSKLRKLLSSPETLRGIAASANAKLEKTIAPLTDRLQEIEAELSKMDAQQKQIFKTFENGRISDEQLVEMLGATKANKQQLLREKGTLELEISKHTLRSIPLETVGESLQNLRLIMNTQTEGYQKELLHLLIEKIVIPSSRNLEGMIIYGSQAFLHAKITS